MTMYWGDVIEELYNNIENLIMLCHSCSAEDPCILKLSKTSPTDIQILTECCACLLENVLEAKQNLYRIYRYNELGDFIAIYKLSDVIIEITSSTATIVPIDKIDTYIEILEESGVQDIESLKNWLLELR